MLKRDIESLANASRQIDFWIKEAMDTMHNQPSYAASCLGEVSKIAKVIRSGDYEEYYGSEPR